MKVAGLLLTGGASTRMGRDKATMMVGGTTMAARVAEALCAVASPVLVVGHEAGTGLETVDDPREGPLVAVACGRKALLERGVDIPTLVVACDLPNMTRDVLAFIASAGTDADVVVPVLDGRDQSLCAWYSTEALDEAVRLSDLGERSMKMLLDSTVSLRRVEESEWLAISKRDTLQDVDVPSDVDGRALD